MIISFDGISQITSGNYDMGLKIAFNPNTNRVTGYFESFTGLDEESGYPKFSCTFFITGNLSDSIGKIITYYPLDSLDDVINGEIKYLDSNTISIQLPQEHGGCWNVMHFAEENPTKFYLQEKSSFIEVHYVTAEKSFFYTNKDDSIKRKAFIIKGDIVYIDQIENDWVHCTFFGKKSVSGWLKLNTLNNF